MQHKETQINITMTTWDGGVSAAMHKQNIWTKKTFAPF